MPFLKSGAAKVAKGAGAPNWLARYRQITFLNLNGLNILATQDKGFCEFTFKNVQNTIKKSTHLSVVGEKERSMFFNILRGKIYDQKKKLI